MQSEIRSLAANGLDYLFVSTIRNYILACRPGKKTLNDNNSYSVQSVSNLFVT